jgi:putative transcriptional regulator
MQNLDTQPHAHLRPSLWSGRLALGRFVLTFSVNRDVKHEPQSRVANRLAALRREHGWSRQELARLLSVHPSTLDDIESGDYLPSLHLAFHLSKLFELPIEAIFSPAMDYPA